MDIQRINSFNYIQNIIVRKNKNNYTTNTLRNSENSSTNLPNYYYPTFKAKIPQNITKESEKFSQELLDRINNAPSLTDIQTYLKAFPQNKGEIFNRTAGNNKNATKTLLMLLLQTTIQYDEDKNVLDKIINKMKKMPDIDYNQKDSSGNSFISNILSNPNGKFFLPLIKNMIFDNDEMSDNLYPQINSELKFLIKMYNIHFKNDLSDKEFNKHINRKTYRKFNIASTNVLKKLNSSEQKEWIKLMHKKDENGDYRYNIDFAESFNDLPTEQLKMVFHIAESIKPYIYINSIKTLSKLHSDKNGLQSWIDLMNTKDDEDEYDYIYPENLPEHYDSLPPEQLAIIPEIINKTNIRLTCDSEKVLSKLYDNKKGLQEWIDLINSKDSNNDYIYTPNLPGIYINLTPEQLGIVPYIKEIETEKLICKAVQKLTTEQVSQINYIGTNLNRRLKLKLLKKLSTLNKEQLDPTIKLLSETTPKGKYIITDRMLDKCENMNARDIVEFLDFCKKHARIVNIKRKLNPTFYTMLSTLNEKQLEQVKELITERNLNKKYIITNDMLNNCTDMTSEETIEFLQFCKEHAIK